MACGISNRQIKSQQDFDGIPRCWSSSRQPRVRIDFAPSATRQLRLQGGRLMIHLVETVSAAVVVLALNIAAIFWVLGSIVELVDRDRRS